MRRRIRTILVLLLVAAGVAAAPPGDGAAQSPTPSDPLAITLPAYREQLQSAQLRLRQRGNAAARDVAATLRNIGPVLMPDGSQVRPDLSGVIAVLQAQPPDSGGGEARLGALLTEVDRSRQPSGAAVGIDAQQRLQRVLDRPEFHPAQPPPDPIGDFVRRLWDSFWNWLMEALAPLGKLIPPASLHLPAVVAGLLIVVGVILWVTRGLRRAMGPEAVQLPIGDGARGMSPAQLRADAVELAQRGEFRAALRALYLAVLLHWDERGKLLFDHSLTNREVLAQLSGGGDAMAMQQLAPLVERFDRFWYGAVPCSHEDYSDFARLVAVAWESE